MVRRPVAGVRWVRGEHRLVDERLADQQLAGQRLEVRVE